MKTITKNNTAIMISAIALASAFAGCTDEPFVNEGLKAKPEMEFLVNDDGVWQSRAGEGGEAEPQNYFGGSLRMIDEDGCGESGDTIYLHRFVEDAIRHDAVSGGKTSSRAAVNSVDDMEAFYVTAAHYKGTWDEKETLANYMCDVPFTKSGSVWTPSADYRWLPNGKTRIFAYAPAANQYLTLSDPSTPGSPKITYDANDNSVDLVVAKTEEISGLPDEVPVLNFKHILTCVKFKVATTIPGIINSIKLNNIYGVGTYSMTDGSEGWTIGTKSYNYTLSIDEPISPKDGADKEFATIYLLPQTTKSTATIAVEYTEPESGISRVLTVKINGQEWSPGTTVTYLMSTEKIEIESSIAITMVKDCLTSAPVSWNATKIDNLELPIGEFYKKFVVQAANSIKYTGNATVDKEDKYHSCTSFNYEFVSASDHKKVDKPEWLDFEILHQSTAGTLASVRVKSNQKTTYATSDGNKKLQSTATVGDIMNYVDLSYSYSEYYRNTANCYVVNAPGYYTFPAVYGNAIVDGEMTSLTYYNPELENVIIDGKYTYCLSKFRNVAGLQIQSGWIDSDISANSSVMTPIAGAKVVWQDADGLVDNVSYDKSYRSVKFRVPKGKIRQGNAIIALYDQEGDIVWSWHIWVTHIDIYNYENQFHTGTFDNLAYYLGWCEPEKYSYEERSVALHFWMNDADGNVKAEKYFDITHLGGEFTDPYGNAPTYQYGRKDPINPGIYMNGKWGYKAVYPAIEQRSFKSGNFSITTSGWSTIQYPTSFADDGYHRWNDKPFFNLWGAVTSSDNGNAKTYSKTIYDPCPPGYRVPDMEHFQISEENVTLSGNKWQIYDPLYKKTVEFPVLPEYRPSSESFVIEKSTVYFRTNQFRSATTSGSREYNKCLMLTNQSTKCLFKDVSSVAYGYYICPVQDCQVPEPVIGTPQDGYFDSEGNWVYLGADVWDYFCWSPDGEWVPYDITSYWQDDDGYWHEY